jgi:peptidyl-tRNA hydrolase
MTAGETASQAGHAFLASYTKVPSEVAAAYVADEGGTNVVLACPDEASVWQAYKRACDASIPCHLWMESDWKGRGPTVTALGIGPVDRSKVKPIVKDFKLMP